MIGVPTTCLNNKLGSDISERRNESERDLAKCFKWVVYTQWNNGQVCMN